LSAHEEGADDDGGGDVEEGKEKRIHETYYGCLKSEYDCLFLFVVQRLPTISSDRSSRLTCLNLTAMKYHTPSMSYVILSALTAAGTLMCLRDNRTRRTKNAPPSSPSHPRPYNPPDFITCQRLQTILSQIRNHISISSDTVRHYLLVCEDFNQQLDPQNQIHDDLNEAKIREALGIWPNFVPLKYINRNDVTPVRWGNVDKHQSGPHEIELNGDLIAALEKAPSVSNT